jgi:hypothetical protein
MPGCGTSVAVSGADVSKEIEELAQMLLGILLLAIWLIATGLLPFTKGRLPHSDTVLNVLAIVAGVLILLGR